MRVFPPYIERFQISEQVEKMIKKAYKKSKKSCLVTFTMPAEAQAEAVNLCGEFNDWNEEDLPLVRRKDGRFSRSVSLPAGQSYRFRYIIDEMRWENDSAADDYAPNPFGTRDSIIEV
jgi:1,4-alpha-glucan branching enzyme